MTNKEESEKGSNRFCCSPDLYKWLNIMCNTILYLPHVIFWIFCVIKHIKKIKDRSLAIWSFIVFPSRKSITQRTLSRYQIEQSEVSAQSFGSQCSVLLCKCSVWALIAVFLIYFWLIVSSWRVFLWGCRKLSQEVFDISPEKRWWGNERDFLLIERTAD